VDAAGPQTHIAATPAVTDSMITITLSGSDDTGGSGILDFDLYGSENGGSFKLLGTDLSPDTTLKIKGKPGSSYCYYSRAKDLVGNLEAVKTSGDACVQVRSSAQPFTFVSPTLNQIICKGDTIKIRWATSASGSVNLFCKANSSASPILISSGIPASTQKYYWANPALTGTTTAQILIVSGIDTTRSDLFTVIQVSKPVVTPGGPLSFCQGGSVVLSTNSATGHRWNTGSSLNSITVTTSGTFVDTAKSNGCRSVSDPIVVTVIPNPVVNAGPDVSITAGGSTTLTATGANTFLWSPLTGLNPSNGNGVSVVASPAQTTTYTVTGTNSSGCVGTDQVVVTVTGGTGPLTAPVISPPTGTYDGSQTVTISTTSPGASIYYTTTGNTPVVGTSFSKLYSAPFTVLQTTSIRAIAVRDGSANSPVAVSLITITNPGIVALPVISPGTGTYGSAQTVSISCSTPGATIYYTISGNTPVVGTSFTRLYTGSFVVNSSATVKAMAVKTGLENSPVASAYITLTNPTPVVSTPVITPGTGLYSGVQTVSISCATSGATIYYTTTGNVPVIGAGFTKVYSGSFQIATSATVRAMGVAPGSINSSVAVSYITIGTSGREAVASSDAIPKDAENPSVYPNPSHSGFFQLMLPNADGDQSEIEIRTIDGRLIQKVINEGTERETLLDLHQQPAGLYIVQVMKGGKVVTLRLAKM
jgi:Chitobiase/beta-hexosaminidase C-terminal domain/Secretion system C-terminal sorting domain